MDNGIPESGITACSQENQEEVNKVVDVIELEKEEEKNVIAVNPKEIFLKEDFKYKISDGFLQNSSISIEIAEIKFCEQIKPEFICDFCLFILWKPLSLTCGHFICESCQEINDDKLICPIDLQSFELPDIEIDGNLHDDISGSMIHCLEGECSWTGKLDELDKHFTKCLFKRITCLQCENILIAHELDEHQMKLCEYRPVVCQYCNETLPFRDLEEHENACFYRPVPCPNQCKTETEPKEITILKLGNLERHLEKECLDRKMACQFADFKCNKMIKFRKLNIHLTKNALIHLDTLCTSTQNSRDLLETHILTMIRLREKIKENDKKINDLQLRCGPQLLWRVVEVQEKYQAAIKSKSSELFSSYFYSTSPYGYKIMMRLMLNGSSAVSTGKYVSVFISLCENSYNNLLNWPFEQKVTVHLINQVSADHISYTIIPNPIKENNDFLKKPDTERNPFFGIDKFAPCSAINGDTEYVVNDTMYIKVNIEPCGIA